MASLATTMYLPTARRVRRALTTILSEITIASQGDASPNVSSTIKSTHRVGIRSSTLMSKAVVVAVVTVVAEVLLVLELVVALVVVVANSIWRGLTVSGSAPPPETLGDVKHAARLKAPREKSQDGREDVHEPLSPGLVVGRESV